MSIFSSGRAGRSWSPASSLLGGLIDMLRAERRSLPPAETQFATFWQGPLDPITYSCLASFPHHGARLRLYTYAGEIDAPPGVEVADARAIVPEEELGSQFLVDGKPSHAKFSNLFRYMMIRSTGCCWVDGDILCLRRPDFGASPIVFGRQFEPSHPWAINTAVLQLPPDHAIVEELIERARAVVGVDQPWGVIGPALVTELAARHGIDRLARDSVQFYPVPPWAFWKPLMPSRAAKVRRAVAKATFLHLWHNNFSLSGYDKQASPPVRSFLHDAFAEIGTLHRFSRAYSEATLRAQLGSWVPV